MSRPSVPRPRTARRRAAALAVGLVAVLGACSHTRQIPDAYGDTTQDNFIEGCVATLTESNDDFSEAAYSDDLANDVCTCSYETIVEDVPFDEFQEINSAQEEDPTELPAAIADPVEACKAEYPNPAASPS